MGLRHRSIRLRVGVLIAVPVLCLLALYGFVASITLGSAVTQQHAKSLRNEVADPVTAFQMQVATERALALLSLADPTNTGVASKLGTQEATTASALRAMTMALQAPSVTSLAGAQEQAAIANLLKTSRNLAYIRADISDDAIPMRVALADYDAVIDAGYPVIDEAANQLTSVPVVTQALAVISLDRASQATQEEWDLLYADIAQGKFPNADRLTFAALANERQSLINAAVPELAPQYRTMLAKNLPAATSNAMLAVETAVINTPWHRGAAPARLAGSKMTFIDYSLALGKALTESSVVLQNQVDHDANTVVLELVLAAGLGLLGTIASILLSLIIGRGLVRQLRELRESALTLAHEQLPAVIERLRSGEPVDPAEYAPAETSTSNEIEQVQNAFSVVQQTAVQAAVDESRLRRGISDVFRNLAGRSQSLLHRQLTLLDGMERRATEPDELEDLFRIDHLTTRMRRHAEGLIILSGEAPARGWRQPVPLVDVLRAAVAEVEDYTRIRVLCRTNAAVAGHAVADVIHLIAELAENATVFSPPNTPVRIQGDIVGRGFAVEIEDRGLGISAARLEEINANLANPPQFDLSGSDRLGLFIAGQLAQRHDIKITLRPSVYGGTTAIVLIPTALVVDEDAFERDPALAAAQNDMALAEGFSGRHALAQSAAEAGNGFALTGPPANGLPGIEYADNGVGGNSVIGNGALGNVAAGNRLGIAGNEVAGTSAADNSTAERFAASSSPSGSFASETTVVRDRFAGGGLGRTTAGTDAPWGRGPAGEDAEAGPDYFARGFSLTGRVTPTADLPAAGGFAVGGPGGGLTGSPVPGSTEPAGLAPVSDDAEPKVSKDEVAKLGLPVRVRQANLAPQLRNSPPSDGSGAPETPGGGSEAESLGTTGTGTIGAGTTGAGTIGIEATRFGARGPGRVPFNTPASPTLASPEAARNTMSALQRGWQLGRSEAAETNDSVFTPRKSPSGQAFNPPDPGAGSANPEPLDSADEQSSE